MEKNQENKQDVVINKMVKDLRYVSQWIEGELFEICITIIFTAITKQLLN